MKILFLPLFQMPTGHHTVANAIIRSLEKRLPDFEYEIVDFFSYADKLLEKAFRHTYLTWIDHSPQTYVWVYRNFMYPSKYTLHHTLCEHKFLTKMNELLDSISPDLIVCTQALPSFLISRLKEYGKNTAPVINIYTDFFVNRLWGLHGIDYHFVPDVRIKNELSANYHIPLEIIFVTGIPVDECFKPKKIDRYEPPYNIIISGGNAGLGDIEQLLKNIYNDKEYNFSVLCGNNHKLHQEILSLDQKNIKPLSYITNRETMHSLYKYSDAIITKPGGVTLSEALTMHLPIFVHSALPGQEQFNFDYLAGQDLINKIDQNKPVIDQLDPFFNDLKKQQILQSKIEKYLLPIQFSAWQKIIDIYESSDKITFQKDAIFHSSSYI
jgi:UDP-N-acetylglucosamine:LPS N-acetylglucosamine transferase